MKSKTILALFAGAVFALAAVRTPGSPQQQNQTSANDAAALAKQVDSLVPAGRWRDAIPVLERLVEIQPSNAERIFELGQFQSWQHGNHAQALLNLKRAAELDSANPKYQDAYAEVLSWDPAARPQALEIFARALKTSPEDENLLLDYADILSWSSATRPRALECYDKVLALHPDNARALAGKAQLLAWSGHSEQALAIYTQILQKDPNNVRALRGQAEILNWHGSHTRAKNLLEQAHGLAPDDPAVMLGLARTEYELGHPAAARMDLAQVTNSDSPEYLQLTHDVNHALGPYFELGYTMRRDGSVLNFDSADALVSAPLGLTNRLTATYQPSLFRTQARNFNGNYYSLALDSQPGEEFRTHLEIAQRTYPGANRETEGSFDADFSPRPSVKLDLGFERAADLESLTSSLGAITSGALVGQVETNLGHIGAAFSNLQHHVDLSLTYTDGVYTGDNLASNRRWSVDGNLGKAIRGGGPYIRAAYGFSYLSFDHDADFEAGSGAPVRVTGGYFSPTRFLLNYGQLSFSGNFGSRAKWDFGGFAGAQNVETTFNSFSSVQFASTFSSHLVLTVSQSNELRAGYDYLNVFNAFHRHLFLFSWRHYF